MKTVIRIFQRDLKQIFRNAMAIILAVGVLILPSLYAWINVYANWDPYGKQSTGNMQVAVIIEDAGSAFRGIQVNVGEEIRKNLEGNDLIDWQFVSKEDGIHGVQAGQYYAAIEIPAAFSESLISIVSAKFETPQITYYANEKKNAIATKITDKVVQTVQSEVNESFITTVVNVVSELLGSVLPENADGTNATVQKILQEIDLAKTGIQGLESTVNSFESILSAVEKINRSVPDAEVEKLLRDMEGTLHSTQDAVAVTKAAVGNLTASADAVLGQSSAALRDAAALLRGLGNLTNTAAEANLKTVSATITEQQTRVAALLRLLESLRSALPGTVTGLNRMIENLTAVSRTLANAETTAAAALQSGNGTRAVAEIGASLSAAAQALETVGEDYGTVRPALGKATDDLVEVLADVANIVSAVSGSEDLRALTANFEAAIGAGTDTLSALSALLSGFAAQLDRLSARIHGLTDSELVNVFYNLMVSNGDSLGSFIACPVTVQTDKIYGIENYGSAMAPFYTTLAIWVGGIILIAIFKPTVKRKKELGNVTFTQEYFGRGLTFLAFALVQGLIICLGDLYFLRIQCEHPFLFLLAGCAASLIFTAFIYSLVAAFGDIGKAVVVIMLVVQLGGSGGTFPIDVTPAFFRAVHPYLPFTFVVNAMRECVCGLWGADYWLDLLKLCAYLGVALVIGLGIRPLLRKPVRYFTKKIEETGLL